MNTQEREHLRHHIEYHTAIDNRETRERAYREEAEAATQDELRKASNAQLLEWHQAWKVYEGIHAIFPGQYVRPDCPADADTIQAEIFRRMDKGEWK